MTRIERPTIKIAAASLLAPLAVLMQILPPIFITPWFMRIDLVAVPWILCWDSIRVEDISFMHPHKRSPRGSVRPGCWRTSGNGDEVHCQRLDVLDTSHIRPQGWRRSKTIRK